jgi:hypothetical protein
MSIELTGLEEVIEGLDLFTDVNKVNAALGKCCALVERSAKQKAPKGELQRSITSKVEDLKGTVYTPLEIAPYIEYGTGIYAEDGKGRQEVPWVYVEDSGRPQHKKVIYTEETAKETAAFLRSKGLDARITSGRHPQPYMRPALHENREEILRRLKEAMTNK